ncbi:hypothetical protein BD410DRAFT_781955 [Rickenella mellea]|uniref:Conserved oligomeric Golgi complex subunit 1 n=1 Tax=Rickenella mellea TaxID=50990 RepID=A0A4Y7QLS7_9AGAM|nr:hypothetical protein BD410DRAFT_781955 [Rickenella mellea]
MNASAPSPSILKSPLLHTSPKSAGPYATLNGASLLPRRTASLASQTLKNDELLPDPDEYFAKYTVAEVKVILNRLRTDADRKQEELRLMVGERYRDILQASTSIIDIQMASKHVQDALEEIKDAVLAEEPTTFATRQGSTTGSNGAYLQAMQSLAAHLKLLLDASEHLWRLLERKLFLQAAWLFLLSRVVFRSLLRESSDDEKSWEGYGINVPEQFPLVQRQWETVSQFRAQIVQKATLSFREQNLTAEEVCASLLSLHLLDSLPLTEALEIFLKQRSRALQVSLAHETGTSGNNPTSSVTDNTRRRHVRQALEALQRVLETIVLTVGTARDVFQQHDSHPPRSMMDQVLLFIQTDSPIPSDLPLPQELQLTTQGLLNTLPSSTHFLLLPPSIKAYKPFIDLESPSCTLPRKTLDQKLRDWFEAATQHLTVSASKWVGELVTIRDVWEVRRSFSQWLVATSKLVDGERKHLALLISDVCHAHIERVWKSALSKIEASFQQDLSKSIAAVRKNDAESGFDIAPVSHLLSAPPAPSISQAGFSPSIAISTFQKYKMAIKHRVDGNTPFVEGLISEAEKAASQLDSDLSATAEDPNENQKVLHAYTPDANALASKVLDLLQSELGAIDFGDESAGRNLVFIGRMVKTLSSSSLLDSLRCDEAEKTAFRSRSHSLYDCTVERWRTQVVSIAVEKCLGSPTQSQDTLSSNLPMATTSLPILMDSLLFLVDSIHRWGSFHRQGSFGEHVLREFAEQLAGSVMARKDGQVKREISWCLLFLQAMCERWGTPVERLDKATLFANQSSGSPQLDPTTVAQSLPHVEYLLAPLLPSQPASAKSPTKPHSTASVTGSGGEFQPAVELAKPTPRFGLLLVEGSATW